MWRCGILISTPVKMFVTFLHSSLHGPFAFIQPPFLCLSPLLPSSSSAAEKLLSEPDPFPFLHFFLLTLVLLHCSYEDSCNYIGTTKIIQGSLHPHFKIPNLNTSARFLSTYKAAYSQGLRLRHGHLFGVISQTYSNWPLSFSTRPYCYQTESSSTRR